VYLQDSSGRNFHYLRISVTDLCNFRCTYCLPKGYQKGLRSESELSPVEIERLVAGFSSMGFWKIRLTGGEPTSRGDIVEIAERVGRVTGVRRLAISSNGFRLKTLSRALVAAGVSAFNISLDSLDRATFNRITGTGKFDDVKSGIEDLLSLGVGAVKLNAVLMRDVNDQVADVLEFAEFVRERPISIRFIELMRTGENHELFSSHHVSSSVLQKIFLEQGWSRIARQNGDGPAVEFRHPKYRGRLGLIAPYASGFCETCNRLRVSSSGALRLCLFGSGEHSLRQYLQADSQRDQLVETVQEVLRLKLPTHFLNEGDYGITRNLSTIGG